MHERYVGSYNLQPIFCVEYDIPTECTLNLIIVL